MPAVKVTDEPKQSWEVDEVMPETTGRLLTVKVAVLPLVGEATQPAAFSIWVMVAVVLPAAVSMPAGTFTVPVPPLMATLAVVVPDVLAPDRL